MGGSPTSQQALAAGVPVLGIASDMDQFLNMAAVVNADVGVLLRADRLGNRRIHEVVGKMLGASRSGINVAMLSRGFGPDAGWRFRAWVDESLKRN